MKIGYIRVSTAEQNTIRQETLMEALGVDEIYMDKVSGKNTNRPELQKMLHYVRKGDTVKVIKKWKEKEITATAAMQLLGVSKTTFYRMVHRNLNI